MIDSETIVKTYAKLLYVHHSLGISAAGSQRQFSIHSRVPLGIYPESYGVNERGEIETFDNNQAQVTLRIGDGFCCGKINGDAKRIPEQRIVLLSDDRMVRYFTGNRLVGFTPKPDGNYRVTEAFQTLIGDFTKPWDDKNRRFFKTSPRWDYIKAIRDSQFGLGEYLDAEKFARFQDEVNALEHNVTRLGFKTPLEACSYLWRHENLRPLVYLLDCVGLYGNETGDGPYSNSRTIGEFKA